MKIRTGADVRAARLKLGWSLNEMGFALRLCMEGDDPRLWNRGGSKIKKIEEGKLHLTGPVSVAIEAFASGFMPEHIRVEAPDSDG